MQNDPSVLATLRRRHIASGVTGIGLGLLAQSATAQTPAAPATPAGAMRQLGGGVAYRPLGRWDVDRLNRVLTADMPRFAGITVQYTAAQQAVTLYRVTYPSRVPEQRNRPVVLSGLVAVPENAPATLPVVSYQHGTVYGKQEVPSFIEQSQETQLMLAQFAGQGYALIGADYIGMGESTEPQGYMVKASHQQSTADLLPAAQAVLADLGKSTSHLFLAGWSQGGYVTMAMLEQLEHNRTPVRAAATASAPVDPWAALGGFLNFPRPNDADWITTLFILIGFSYETYYALPGLAQSIIRPEYLDVSRRAYEGQAVDPSQVPTSIRRMVQAPYFDPQFFTDSAFGQLLARNQAYRWIVRSPLRNYYGETDEAISLGVGRLAMNFQKALGNDKVEAVSTGPTTHRGTYVTAAPHWKQWFDSLL
jgi:pimeloyl-ACP methyl ester carboxylesterase